MPAYENDPGLGNYDDPLNLHEDLELPEYVPDVEIPEETDSADDLPEEPAEDVAPEEEPPAETVPPVTSADLQMEAVLSAVSAGTRSALWEQGVYSYAQLLQTPHQDLLTPRGHLSRAQLDELSRWIGPAPPELLSRKRTTPNLSMSPSLARQRKSRWLQLRGAVRT